MYPQGIKIRDIQHLLRSTITAEAARKARKAREAEAAEAAEKKQQQ